MSSAGDPVKLQKYLESFFIKASQKKEEGYFIPEDEPIYLPKGSKREKEFLETIEEDDDDWVDIPLD